MSGYEISQNRRKAGVASAAILGVSAIASFLGLLVYTRYLATFPATSVLVLATTVLIVISASAWLGHTIWNKGARWAAVCLLAWAFVKQVAPNLLYPNVLPRAVFMLAGVLAITAIIPTRTKPTHHHQSDLL